MTSSIRGSLGDLKKLVEQRDEEEVENARAKLTSDNEVKFKLVLGHQLESSYNFSTLLELSDPNLKRPLYPDERVKIYDFLGACIDTFVGRTITNVMMHFKRDDEDDEAYDPVGGVSMPVKHFGINENSKARIHGYFNSSGYFVVTRLDWFHLYHERKERAKGK